MQIRQRRQRLWIGPSQIENAAPQLDGLFALTEDVGRDLCHARVAVGQRLIAGRDVEHLLVDAVEIFPAFGAEVETLERFERLRRARLVLKNSQVTSDGRVGIVDNVGQHFTKAQVQLDELARIVGHGDATAKYAGQLLEIALLVVDTIEECQRLGVVGVEAEDLPQDFLGARQVAKLGFEHGRQAHEHVLADRAVAGLASGFRHGRHVRFPLVGGAGQAQGLVQGLLRRRRFHHRPRPVIERRDLIDEPILGDVRQTAQNALALFAVRLRRQLDLVDPHQLLPLFAHAVERLEHLGNLPLHGSAGHETFQRRARFFVLGRDAEDFLVCLDGFRQIAECDFENLGQAVGE